MLQLQAQQEPRVTLLQPPPAALPQPPEAPRPCREPVTTTHSHERRNPGLPPPTKRRMKDLDNLQSRLASEESTLSATHEQIEAAHGRIKALNEHIEETKREIAETEQHIEKLHEHIQTVEKRINLLREYIDMVDSGDGLVDQNVEAQAAEPRPKSAKPPEPAPDVSRAKGGEPLTDALLSMSTEAGDDEEGLVDLEFVQPSESTPAKQQVVPASFEDLEEDLLTDELLPRTETFGQELLLILAYHRKAVAPKDVARAFRRLDYAPKISPTAKNVQVEVDSETQLFEYAGNKIVLTREGREEAQRLLEQLAQEK